MYKNIKPLQPYFFSLREIKSNVSLDLKLPVTWKYEKIVQVYKTLEVKIATEDKDKNEKQAKKEADLEARIEARLRLKLDNEYSHKSKDDKIEFLSSQLQNRSLKNHSHLLQTSTLPLNIPDYLISTESINN